MQNIYPNRENTVSTLLRERYGTLYACPSDHPDLDDPDLSGGRKIFISHQTEKWKDDFMDKAREILLRVKESDVTDFLQCFDDWTKDNISATWYTKNFMIEDLFRLYRDEGPEALTFFRRLAIFPNQSTRWGDAVDEHADPAAKCLRTILEVPPILRMQVLRQIMEAMDRSGKHAGWVVCSFGNSSWTIQRKLTAMKQSNGNDDDILQYVSKVIRVCEDSAGVPNYKLDARIHEIDGKYATGLWHFLRLSIRRLLLTFRG